VKEREEERGEEKVEDERGSETKEGEEGREERAILYLSSVSPTIKNSG